MGRRILKVLTSVCVLLCWAVAYAQPTASFTVMNDHGCSPLIVSFKNTSTGHIASYFWDFGNGNTSVQKNPGAIYTAGGSYNVRLIVKDSSGATDTLTKSGAVTVSSLPKPGFKYDVSSGCTPLTVHFTDTSTASAGINSWEWDFGDGSISSSQNPSHSYATAGTYSVSLTVTDANGCKNSLVKSKIIDAVVKPQVFFNSDGQDFCDSIATVSFSDASLTEVSGKTRWHWVFGDGDTSNLQNPQHTYKHFGSYTVKLFITNEGVCKDSVVRFNYINLVKHTYDFSADSTHGCGLFQINFTNLTSPNPFGLNYIWTFGDGNSSTQVNPSNIYANPGKYTVTLYVSSPTGCRDTVKKVNYISIGTPPTAAFTSSDSISCQPPLTVNFTDKSVNAKSWRWNFGDGNFSTAQNPSHTYTGYGNFTVSLTVKNAEGCPDSTVFQDMVEVKKPTAIIFSPEPEGCKGSNTILFYDHSESIVPVKEWYWDFGDGDTSRQQNPFHSYADTGKYTVKLKIVTDSGCVDSSVIPKFVSIGNKPRALFYATPQDSCIQDMFVSFINKSDSFTPNPDKYVWDFGNGETLTTTSPIGPKKFYNVNPGKYTVRLIVFSNGCSDTLIRTNYITIHGPKANFEYYQSPCAPDSIYFTDRSLGDNKYLWHFGDGDSSVNRNPVHFYDSAGSYRVTLKVWDTVMGCYNDTFMIVNVPNFQNYAAGFSASQTSGCFPVTVTFNDTTFRAVSWQWDFGNGQTSQNRSETITYSEPGLYTVKLTTTNSFGCTESVTRTNFIKVFGVTPSFDICSSHECGAGGVRFFDFTRSSDPITSRIWDFGDGTTLTTTDTVVTHTYTSLPSDQNTGYNVLLTVRDSAGCSGASASRVRLTQPQLAIGTSIQPGCGRLEYQFYSFSTNGIPVGPLQYRWQFMNGPVASTGSTFGRSIDSSGKYYVKLIYQDYYGCTDTVVDTFIATVATLKAGFTQSDTFSTCPPFTVQFSDTSHRGNTSITAWHWDFGDGSTSALSNPEKIYVLPGKYTVRLKVTDAVGCVDSTFKTNVVHVKGPTGTYSFSPSKGCDTVVAVFHASSNNASRLNWDLGDGTIVNDSNFTHIYSTPGTYVPLLILGDTLGCTYKAPAFDTIHVWGHDHAGMSASDSTICDTGIVKFTDQTIYAQKPSYWYWSFGDGTSSNDTNPVHFYHRYDSFTVKLVIRDSTGCFDSITKKKWVVVSDQVKPHIGLASPNQCQQQTVNFIDSTISPAFPINLWRWRFGDGDSSSLQNPTHTYDTSGTFTVSLFVVNQHGCTDSVTRTITLLHKPVANLKFSSGCFGDTLTFADSSTSVDGTVSSRIIYFGDGDSSTALVAKHRYRVFGTYSAKLVAVSQFGCIDSTRRTVVVSPKPDANFVTTPVCQYDSMRFADSSALAAGAILQWDWNFGDGNTASVQSPAHHYTASGNYNVRLIVTSDQGCKDTVTKTVTVYSKPAAAFHFINICGADTARFTDSSTVTGDSIVARAWSFGDGGTSALQNPEHHYTSAGTYMVRLVVTTQHNCVDTLQDTIVVHPMPKAGFTATNACFGNSVNFTDTSSVATGSIASWLWDFGDTSFSALANPQHDYRGAGTYHVKLEVATDNGCKDSATAVVTVYPKPRANFTATTVCLNDTTQFSDSSNVSSGSIVSWSWNFGDGDTSVLQNPQHHYSGSGSYSVRLVITTDKGCMDTISKNVIVDPKPQASFTANNSCQADSVHFVNTSSIATGSINTYAWDFGDGNSSSAISPWHSFSAAGTYVVILYTTSDKGCKDTATDTVIIYPMPKAEFHTAPVCQYDSLRLADSSTVASGAIVQWAWNFGDGSVSSNQHPAHHYAASGRYDVVLLVTTDHGCRDSIRKTVTILPKPQASFRFADICGIDTAGFTDESSVANDTIASWNWNFGDGSTSALQSPGHHYALPGTYTVHLQVTTNHGCTDSTTRNILVFPMPAADFVTSDVCFGNSVSFTDSSKISSGNIASWAWDFGDSGTSSQSSPQHNYMRAGAYAVKLKVVSDNGCTDSIIKNVTVYPKPHARFGASTVCFEDTTKFADSSTVSSGSIVSWDWDLGDGATSAAQNPKHMYVGNATYSVTLIITTDKGCKDTLKKDVLVYPKPIASYTFSNVCLADSIHFNNTSLVSSGSIATYIWDFGDTRTSTQKHPYHHYTSAGKYPVTLYVSSDLGCRDTVVDTVTIYPRPKAGFSVPAVCFKDSSRFSNSSTVSTGSLTNYSWSFGDGGVSTDKAPAHLYAASGTYNVQLIVSSDHGCTDTIKSTATVYPKPRAAFTASNSCLVDSVVFTDKSTVSSGNIVGHNWDFGDGSSSALANPKHLYPRANTYTVRLIVTTDNGCTDTIKNDVIIYPEPKAGFSGTTECFRNATSFTDQSTVSSGSIASYYWSFGDGQTSVVQNPQYIYKASGTYTVKEIVTTDHGCKDSASQFITIYPKPKAAFRTANVCYGNAAQFVDASTVSSGSVVAWQWDFGDLGTSNLQNPQHFYQAGTYAPRLIVTTDNGCKDTFTGNIIINPKPVADFKEKAVCLSDSTQFTDASAISKGSIVSYSWDFGDGKTSALQNPWHKYTAPGTYNVILYVASDSGCRDTVTYPLIIHPMPVARFGVQPVCRLQPAAFTDSSTVSSGIVVAWQWDFGDGGVSTLQNPTHVYQKDTIYTVKLIVSTDNGCSDTTVRRQLIYPLPEPDFNATINCIYDPVRFTDRSGIKSGALTGWHWDFGDGDTSSLQNPSHLYKADGTYNVMLVTTSSYGCMDTIKKPVIVNPKPNVAWSVSPVCLHDSSRFADATTIHTGKLKEWYWQFGDGDTSHRKNPVHLYKRADSFFVKLVVTSDSGCTDTLIKRATVWPLPKANWISGDVCLNDTTRFFDKSTIAWGTVDHWLWKFGDGATASAQNAKHVYTAPGTYQVTLIAYSSHNCLDSIIKKVTVYPRSQPKFHVDGVCLYSASHFHDSSTITGGKIQSWLWDLGDGTTMSLPDPIHLYTSPGKYKVRLVTTTDHGCSDTFYRTAQVYNLPQADFAPQSLCLPDSITFRDQSTSLDGRVNGWVWDFGDGKTSTDSMPKHKYTRVGYYNVKLSVTTTLGCGGSVSKRIHVVNLYPDFAVSDTLGCLNKAISFTDKSKSDTIITAWLWDFGDGTTDNSQNPVHAYTSSGSYNVKLTITDGTGCDTIIEKKKLIQILDTAAPVAPRIYRVTVQSDNSVKIVFQKYSGIDFSNYILERDMGSGTFASIYTSTNRNDTVYTETGLNTLHNTYTYRLIINNICGYLTPSFRTVAHTTINVTAKQALNRAPLVWTPYKGWPVKYYVIYRQDVNHAGRWDSITTVQDTSYIDTAIICYRTHQYRIKAIGLDSIRQISYSDTAAVSPLYVPNVRPNDIIRATVQDDNQSVLVEWDPSLNRKPWYYILERSKDNVHYNQVGLYPRGLYNGIDYNVDVHDTSYYYRMTVQDSCGDLSALSNIGKTILLKADDTLAIDHPGLVWTHYHEWPLGVDYYAVQLKNKANGEWTTVGTVSAIDTEFVDQVTNINMPEYCYRVVSYQRHNDNIVSISNQVCLRTQMKVYVPNAFTPTNDGRNEMFFAKGIFVFQYSLKIYNRWGELMFETNDINKGWDGYYQGSKCQQDVYIYEIFAKGSGGQTFFKKGNITLLR